MHNPRKSLLVVGPAALDPFGQFGNRAARRHPRRDPNGHPNGNPKPNPNPEPEPNPNPEPNPDAADWVKVFEGMTPAEVKTQFDQAKDAREAAEKWNQIQKAFTGEGGGTPPDPAQLATDLSAARQGEREAKVENAILLLAPTEGANPNSLIDSRSFMTRIASLNLDPTATDFNEKVTAEIKAVAAAHPITGIPRGPLPNPQQGNPGHQKTESTVSAGRARYKERNPK
ncbi:MAG: hypothetical protein WA972_08470 [Rhodococcus qingshengii]